MSVVVKPFQEYVVVFVRYQEYVLLIRKARPEWQAGKLNFPGGHIEPGESPVSAAHRELLEETHIMGVEWRNVGEILFNGGKVHIFECDPKNPQQDPVNTDETEPVAWYPMRGILNRNDLIANLRVLIPILYVGTTFITIRDIGGWQQVKIAEPQPDELIT
jgi:8-oxo-dGTP pyrophosphatase MutT (NUDIX family)